MRRPSAHLGDAVSFGSDTGSLQSVGDRVHRCDPVHVVSCRFTRTLWKDVVVLLILVKFWVTNSIINYTDILRFEQYICGRGAALISPLAASNLKKASHVLLPFSTYFTLLKKIHRGTISGAGLGKIVILISRKD